MILVVTGSRGVTSEDVVRAALVNTVQQAGSRPSLVLHGACPGSPDMVADRLARAKGYPVQPVPAPWDEFERQGRRNAAGPHRNKHMLRAAKHLGEAMAMPVWVCAVWDGKSSGTKGTIEEAWALGLSVCILELREESDGDGRGYHLELRQPQVQQGDAC